MNSGPKSFRQLIETLQSLPSVGQKTATRLAYNMVTKDKFNAMKLAHAIENAIQSIQICAQCGGLSENELCDICCDEYREKDKLCIVENARDIFIIEESGQYHGFYFVFENLEQFETEKLIHVVEKGAQEIIFAFTPGIQGDSLILFIEDKLKDFDLIYTKIAQGIPTGVNIENVDLMSLSRALSDRTKI